MVDEVGGKAQGQELSGYLRARLPDGLVVIQAEQETLRPLLLEERPVILGSSKPLRGRVPAR